MTNIEQFKRHIRKCGFTTTDYQGQLFQGVVNLLPYHYKDLDGNHYLISSINFVIFKGSDTKQGDLGCISFYYGGRGRKKGCRTVSPKQILKKVVCPNDANEAIKVYETWKQESDKTIKSWKVIL